MTISEKNQTAGGVQDIGNFWKKTPGIFRIFTLPFEIPYKMKLLPWKFHKIVFHPLEFPRPKAKTHGIPYISSGLPQQIPLLFVLTPGISSSFYLYIQCPLLGNSMPSTPLFGFISGIAHIVYWLNWVLLNKNTALLILRVF